MAGPKAREELAFLFPGQGSQSLGMMGSLSEEFGIVSERFQEASEVLGFDLWKLVLDGPIENLNLTENTQPAILAASVSTWDIWNTCDGQRPTIMCGHSFGEYSALVCAGAISYLDAVKLVATRGQLMQKSGSGGVGSMAAIFGLPKEILNEICAKVSSIGICDCANFNSSGQIVISGQPKAISAACAEAKASGAKRALVLPVSVPAHSRLMSSAAKEFSEYLLDIEIHAPKIRILHNVDVMSHSKPEEIRLALEQQLYSPVKWDDTINQLFDLGYRKGYECGPGKILSGLAKRINLEFECVPLVDRATIEAQISKNGNSEL